MYQFDTVKFDDESYLPVGNEIDKTVINLKS